VGLAAPQVFLEEPAAVPTQRTFLRFLPALLGAAALGSCGPQRGPAVPEDLAGDATALGNPAFRTWDDALNEPFLGELVLAAQRELARADPSGSGALPPAYYLAISGGGADGAFGAGLLCGWTALGTRPEFHVVTGISTGALTAPFAFLGPEYDEELRTVYTTVGTRQVFRFRGMMSALFSDALTDTTPLRRLMESLVDEEMMRDIAREHARGRVLVVATTNLDADRGMIWNIGLIAASGDPGALRLIQDVLMASAAIPAAFPPVMIDVEAAGKRYQEMHVDGAAKAQVFLYPPSLELKSESLARGIQRERVAFVIRNARLGPNWAETRRRALSIAGRAIGALIHSQGIGDLFRIYLITRRDHVDFNLAYIPESFRSEPAEHFDPVFMSELFDLGFTAASAPGGYPWTTKPPGWVDGEHALPAED
jgi:hypothetical protein